MESTIFFDIRLVFRGFFVAGCTDGPLEGLYDGVVKTSIYCVVCPGAIHNIHTCIVETHPGTQLLVYLCF